MLGNPPVAFAVAHLDEIEETPHRSCRLRPVRHHFGIAAFGVNAWTGHAPGDRMIPEHEEDSDEELYLVLRGRALFELDGDRLDATTGTLVFVRPGVKRTAFAEEAESSILALGATPGRAYEAAGWEVWGELDPLYQAGEYAEAADRGRELIDAHPQYPAVAYNVACCESLAGRPADAIEHLRQALAQSETLRELAKTDSDLDPIREEPAFKQLSGA
jgi:mannose-6-phosphate isomerase-like protein (cupin superfamily)